MIAAMWYERASDLGHARPTTTWLLAQRPWCRERSAESDRSVPKPRTLPTTMRCAILRNLIVVLLGLLADSSEAGQMAEETGGAAAPEGQ